MKRRKRELTLSENTESKMARTPRIYIGVKTSTLNKLHKLVPPKEWESAPQYIDRIVRMLENHLLLEKL